MARTAARTTTGQPTPHHVAIDEMLARAGEVTGRLKAIQTECQAELDALVIEHRNRTAPIKQELEALDKSIRTYTKKHQVDLFEGRDRIDLVNGALLHQLEHRVKRVRNMLEQLENIGATEAIKIAKSVDWDVLEQWTDERLIEVGTERVKKETFAYELIEAKKAKKVAREAA